jgi:hypothetical protein
MWYVTTSEGDGKESNSNNMIMCWDSEYRRVDFFPWKSYEYFLNIADILYNHDIFYVTI